MGRNPTHHSKPPGQDHGSCRSRSPSRKSQYRTERSPTLHGKSLRDRSPPSEIYSVCPKFPKHARSTSPCYPFPQTKRLKGSGAGEVREAEQERINGRGISWNIQKGGCEGDAGSDRKEKLLGRNDTDGKSSRSRHGTSPSDRDCRSRHRLSPQHVCDTRVVEKVNEGRDRNHSRWNDSRMHREIETERVERKTVKDSTSNLCSRSRHDTSPSDQPHWSRHRSYVPQQICDTRYGKKIIEDHERSFSRRNHRSMHMEYDTERMERMTAKESTSYRPSRPTLGSPSDRNCRSRYRSYSPQHTSTIREKDKLFVGCERNHRSIHRGNDNKSRERFTGKENTGHRSSRSRDGTSPSDRHGGSGYRFSSQHAGDTRDEEKVIGGRQRNHRRQSDRGMHMENETERLERRTAKDCSGNQSLRSRHGQSTSPLNGHHKIRYRMHFTEAAETRAHNEVPKLSEAKDSRIYENDLVVRAAEEILEAQKKQKELFELSGKLAVETSRFRGDGLKMKRISNENDFDEHYDNARTQVICKLNLAPRKKKLLVFDLNGLLIYREFCFNNSVPRDRMPDGKCGNHLVFKRPFAEEFMLFCLERFEVGIWTSALGKNIDGVLDCVMENLKSRLIFVWDQHQCTDFGFKSVENKMKPLFFKELKKVWDQFKGKFSASDTLLIDDEPYKSLLNPPYSGIFLDSYIPDNGGDNALDPKRKLGKYLAGLAVADDVQRYVKDNPFGRPAISSEHPDWNYYSTILRKIGKYL